MSGPSGGQGTESGADRRSEPEFARVSYGLHIRYDGTTDGPYSEEQLRRAAGLLPPGVEVHTIQGWMPLTEGLDRLTADRLADAATHHRVAAAPGTVVDGLRWTGATWVPADRVRTHGDPIGDWAPARRVSTHGELVEDGNSVLRLIAWAAGLTLLGILIWQWEHVVAFALAALLAIPLVLTIGWLTKWDESVLVVAVVGALVLAVVAGVLGFDSPEDSSATSRLDPVVTSEREFDGGPSMARNWSQSNLYGCLSRLGYATERVELHDSYIVLSGASDPRVPARLQLDWIESEQLFVFQPSPAIGGSFDRALDDAGCPA